MGIILASLKNLFLAIRNFPDRLLTNEKLKRSILQAIPFWIASLITSFVAIFYAKSFEIAENFSAAIYQYEPWLLFIISPACFISSWYIVKRFAPNAAGSGIPQVMAAVDLAAPINEQKLKKLLSLRIIFVKIFSSIILVLGGGAIGREGPTIQIAGSIFRKVHEWLPDWWPKITNKNMIMTGAAAGLAAAFNTPLGGIVFAIEELTKTHLSHFKSAIFTAVIIAGLTVQSIVGSYLYLGFPDTSNLSTYILLWVILLAFISGIMGSYMSKTIWSFLKWKRENIQKNKHQIIFLLISSLILASLAFFVNEGVLGSGKSIMDTTLFTEDKYTEWYMPLLRTFSPIISFTSGSSGGIFAPGLSAGASVGSVFSGLLSLSPSDTNLMILAGMVAFLTGITRAPFTSAILVLEMTDGNNLILHLMLAAIVASIFSNLVDQKSLYDHLRDHYKQNLKGT